MSWAFKTGSVFGDKVHFIGFRVKCGLCKQSNRNFAGRFAVKLTWEIGGASANNGGSGGGRQAPLLVEGP